MTVRIFLQSMLRDSIRHKCFQMCWLHWNATRIQVRAEVTTDLTPLLPSAYPGKRVRHRRVDHVTACIQVLIGRIHHVSDIHERNIQAGIHFSHGLPDDIQLCRRPDRGGRTNHDNFRQRAGTPDGHDGWRKCCPDARNIS